ncbi:MAG: hypothetical protein VB934_03275 [Polyangiaceae bacterium]
MLKKCLRDQWSVDDLDWSLTPRRLSRDDEISIVQYFTDMASIERLAKALFVEQAKRAHDPLLKEILESFIEDEERHAVVAERLAKHYDRHQYREYETNPHLLRFAPCFIAAIQQVSAEVANAYITTGEILLDVALLRSLSDFVDDAMCEGAMEFIDRDESRHIAVDFYMLEYYCSDQYRQHLTEAPRKTLIARGKQLKTFVSMLYHSGPFARDVFFGPMDMCDPSGKRMLQAFKRIQLVAAKPSVARRPITRFFRVIQVLFNHPILGRLFGRLLARVIGLDPRVLPELYTRAEERRASSMSFDDFAKEILAIKFASS